MKKIIARNLPLTKKYNFVSVARTEDFCQCENCGKAITNIATLKSESGTHYVGLDCMDTLIENNLMLEKESYVEYLFSAKPALDKAKITRAKILKAQKKNPSYKATLKVLEDGRFGFSYDQDGLRGFKEPMGWDYTFNPKYKELTLSILSGVYN